MRPVENGTRPLIATIQEVLRNLRAGTRQAAVRGAERVVGELFAVTEVFAPGVVRSKAEAEASSAIGLHVYAVV